MPLFSLPFAVNTARPSQRIAFAPRARKRKRAPSDSSSSSSSDDKQILSGESPPPLPAASTNPQSLTPLEVEQYRLAGLNLDAQLPAQNDRQFPHRRLPPPKPAEPDRGRRRRSRSRGGEGDETENERRREISRVRAEADEKSTKGLRTGLRLQHLGVLTTVLHKCLIDGDIPRASRAWGLLIRGKIGSQEVDLRSSGYWGIGAELLIRGHDQQRSAEGQTEHDNGDDAPEQSDEEREGDISKLRGGPKRWGSAAGLEKAKEYYEILILQYPFLRQYSHSVSALDFWPAMLGCEIYGIQWEQKDELRRLALADGDDMVDHSDSSSLGHDEDYIRDDHVGTRSPRQRRREKAEKRKKKEEEIRKRALEAAVRVADRMDELMMSPPYTDSETLLRLRGMLALYVGDLSAPAPPPDEESESDEDEDAQQGFERRERETAYGIGLEARNRERQRANELFKKVIAKGGNVDIALASTHTDENIDD